MNIKYMRWAVDEKYYSELTPQHVADLNGDFEYIEQSCTVHGYNQGLRNGIIITAAAAVGVALGVEAARVIKKRKQLKRKQKVKTS